MRHGIALLAILSLALSLRVWNLQYGLPQILHPDEPSILQPALRIADLEHFDPDPKYFIYPSLQMYVLSLCFYLEGVFSPGGSLTRPVLPDVIAAARFGRVVTAFFGVATVALVYLIACRHLSRRKGQAAALLLALTPLHALDSHYTNVDIPMTFWLLLACLLVLESMRDGGVTWLLLGAAALGFAGATKYTALTAAPLLPAAVFLTCAPMQRPWTRSRRITAGLVVCSIAFLAGAPYTLLSYQDALAALRFEQSHVQSGHWGFDLYPEGWIFHRFVYQLFAGFPFALGLPLYLAALGGVAWTARRPPRSRWALAAAAVPILAVVGYSRVVFPRYLVPLLPFLVIPAAEVLVDLASSARQKIRSGAMLAGAVVVVSTAAFTSSQLKILEPQNATLASRWIEQNIPRGSRITVATLFWTLSIPDGEYQFVDTTSDPFGGVPSEWLVVSSWFETSMERGDLRDGPENRLLKSLAGSASAPYDVAARFESRYLGEGFYGLLDPCFKNQFESPDITIYRKRRGGG